MKKAKSSFRGVGMNNIRIEFANQSCYSYQALEIIYEIDRFMKIWQAIYAISDISIFKVFAFR